MKLRFLGHSFFQLGFGDINVLVDPFINNTSTDPGFKTLVECPLNEEQIRDAAIILVSHEHFDHFDKKAIEHIAARDNALVLGHDSVLQELSLPKGLLKPLSMNNPLTVRGVKVTPMPAHHPNAFYPMGFLIESEGKTVYHAGDTSLLDEFSNIKADIALFPIGGVFTMDLIDAVRAAKTMKPQAVVPMHYNTFGMIMADPNEFKQRIDKSILKTEVKVLKPGDEIEL